MTFITDFLAGLGAWLTGFWGLVTDSIDAALGIFWDGTNLTIMGYLGLFGLAVGLVYMGIGFVTRLIRK